MRSNTLILLSVAAATLSTFPKDAVAGPPAQIPRDPYEPKTRYRSASRSPAQRLLERQRQKNLKRSKV